MKVRFANASDMPALIAMGAKFHACSEHAEHVAYCERSAYATALAIMQVGFILIAEREGEPVGMIGIAIGPMLMNHAILLAQEVMWWVDEGARSTGAALGLMHHAERISRDRGAHRLQMVALSNSPAHVARIYERRGYRASESAFIKEL